MSGGKTFVIAWELGGGMGHINRLLSITRPLVARGHRPIFAFRNTRETEGVTRAMPGALVVAAPVFRKDPTKPVESKGFVCNYADVLHRCGYASTEALSPLVQRWRQFFEATKPALILSDHSPTAVLAAAGRIPVVHIGSGFATPPEGKPFLALHANSSAGAREREAAVLKSIGEVQARFGGPQVAGISQLLGFAENFTCSLPELDPYRSVRPAPAIGPVDALPKPQPIGGESFLFGYLTAQDVRVPQLLANLAKAKIRCGIYVRQAPPDFGRIVAGTTVTLYAAPQKLPEALASASGIIHHGGLATTEAALAMGRPQFLLPRHLEQSLTADGIERMGCGLNLARQSSDPGETIRRALASGTFSKAVAATAGRISERPQVDVAAKIVEACVRRLG